MNTAIEFIVSFKFPYKVAEEREREREEVSSKIIEFEISNRVIGSVIGIARHIREVGADGATTSHGRAPVEKNQCEW